MAAMHARPADRAVRLDTVYFNNTLLLITFYNLYEGQKLIFMSKLHKKFPRKKKKTKLRGKHLKRVCTEQYSL